MSVEVRLGCGDVDGVLPEPRACCLSCHDDEDLGLADLPEFHLEHRQGSRSRVTVVVGICCNYLSMRGRLTRDQWAAMLRAWRRRQQG